MYTQPDLKLVKRSSLPFELFIHDCCYFWCWCFGVEESAWWRPRSEPGVLSTLLDFWLATYGRVCVVLGGKPTPCFFFFATEFAKSNFLPCQLSMITDHAIHVRWRRREIRFNLFGTLSLKLLMPVDFAVSGYPWHWVETKWCWLATQDHAKPVSSYDCQWHLVDLFQAETLGYKANIVLT